MAGIEYNSPPMRLEKIKCVNLAHRLRCGRNGDESQISRGRKNSVAVNAIQRMDLIQKERNLAKQFPLWVLAQKAAENQQIEQHLNCDGRTVGFNLPEVVVMMRPPIVAGHGKSQREQV
jgi:hypothetical protein